MPACALGLTYININTTLILFMQDIIFCFLNFAPGDLRDFPVRHVQFHGTVMEVFENVLYFGQKPRGDGGRRIITDSGHSRLFGADRRLIPGAVK